MHYDSIFQLQFDRRFSLISKRNLHKSEISNFDNLEIGVSVFRKKFCRLFPLVLATLNQVSSPNGVGCHRRRTLASVLEQDFNESPEKEAFEVLNVK